MTSELRAGDIRLLARELEPGVIQIQTSSRVSRWQGFHVTCYLVGEILIDTGFAKAGEVTRRYLADHRIGMIACTHNHEDHTGNCSPLSFDHACPVYLANADKAWEEGVDKMARYRRVWWGKPDYYRPEEMPDVLRAGGRELSAVPTPGHSQTHTAFFEPGTGLLFAGDLFITGGVTAVMSHENPFESIRSLRRVADLSPRRMLNGHGLVMDDPVNSLREKADKIEEAAGRVGEMHRRGDSERRIVRRVFSNGWAKDWFTATLTRGEFSRRNFVRACIRCQVG
jgi:glyoxylase-like metal-dependent hydrolase (beta-lactamase superfamily II)